MTGASFQTEDVTYIMCRVNKVKERPQNLHIFLQDLRIIVWSVGVRNEWFLVVLEGWECLGSPMDCCLVTLVDF